MPDLFGKHPCVLSPVPYNGPLENINLNQGNEKCWPVWIWKEC
jgi:hypothetical protein